MASKGRINYTCDQINELLGYVQRLSQATHVTLRQDEYLRILDAVEILNNFDLDYENLINKPVIPETISQLYDDSKFVTNDKVEAAKDWAMMLVNESDDYNERTYITKRDAENMVSQSYDDMTIELINHKDYAEKSYAKKEDIVFKEYELEEHKHSATDIRSCLSDENLYTLVDDLRKLDNVFAEYEDKTEEYLSRLVETNNKIEQVQSKAEVAMARFNKDVSEVASSLDLKADREEVRKAIADLDKPHEHLNKDLLDLLDKTVLRKWNATTNFVGNIQKIKIDDSDPEALDVWQTENSKITTATVGGIDKGTDLENKTLYDIFKLMLYPDPSHENLLEKTVSELENAVNEIKALKDKVYSLEEESAKDKARIAELEERSKASEEKISELEATVNEKFEAVNTRLDDIDENIKDVDASIEDVNAKIDAVNANIEVVNTNVGNVNANIEAANKNIEDINTNIETVNTNIETISASIETINTNLGQAQEDIEDLKKRATL